MSEKQVEAETKVRDPVKHRRFWRLVLQDRKGRSRLAAAPLEANALLPDMAFKVNELLSSDRPSLLTRTLLTPRVHIVTLAEPSCLRFGDLSRRDDIKAFNNDAYEAIFGHETHDRTLSQALTDPRQTSVALDVMQHYSSQLASDIQRCASVAADIGAARVFSKDHKGMKALKISHEVNAGILMAGMVSSVLLLAFALVIGVSVTARSWNVDAQAGFAAAEVGVAYVSFAVHVYRAAMR